MTAHALLVSSAIQLPDSTSTLNLGDEALSAVLASVLEAKLGLPVRRAVHLNGNPPESIAPHVPMRPFRALAHEVRDAQLVVMGGGTLLQPELGLLRWQAVVAAACRHYGVPLFLAHVGADPLTKPIHRLLASHICRSADSIIVRDEASRRTVAEVSGCEAVVGADAMFLDPSLLKPARLPTVRPRKIAVNLRRDAPDGLTARLAAAINECADDGAEIWLVPTDRRPTWDRVGLRSLEDRLDPRLALRWVSDDATWEAVLALLADCDLAVGMRLHFLIFAYLAGAPLLALVSGRKAESFVTDAGVSTRSIATGVTSLAAAIADVRPVDPAARASMCERAQPTLEAALRAVRRV